jgi:hypothetical protein
VEHVAEGPGEQSEDSSRVFPRRWWGHKNFIVSELADQADLLSKPLSDHAGT